MKKTAEQIAAAFKTVEECEHYIKNVKERSPVDATRRIHSAMRRAIDIRSSKYIHDAKTPAAVELYEALSAKEYARNAYAGRFRPTIKKYGGIVKAADTSVSKSDAEALEQLRRLVALGLRDLTFEATILRYQNEFSAKAIEKARHNLELVDLEGELRSAPADAEVNMGRQ